MGSYYEELNISPGFNMTSRASFLATRPTFVCATVVFKRTCS